MRRADAAGLLALAVLVGGALATARVPDAGTGWRVACVACWLAASGLALWLAPRATSTRLVIGVAIGLRVLAFPALPSLSDDVYRYVWDGSLVVDGVSPYAHVPSAGALDAFRDREGPALLYERMNSPGVHSVYPPVSQAAFAAAARSGEWPVSWYVLKGILCLAELVGVVALSRVLVPSRLALYAWQPLAVIEIAGQGHTEGLLVGAVGVVVWAVVQRRRAASAMSLVVAGWTKLFPFVALPSLLVRCSARGRLAALALAVSLGATLLPADGIANVVASLRLYGGALDFYSAPFLVVKAALYPLMGEPAGRAAASILSGLWLAAVGWASVRASDETRTVTLVVVTFVGYMLANPMLHPWNGLGALAAATLLRRPQAVLWLLGVAPLTYLRYVDTGWPAYDAALWLGWGGAALAVWLSRARARPTHSPSPRRSEASGSQLV